MSTEPLSDEVLREGLKDMLQGTQHHITQPRMDDDANSDDDSLRNRGWMTTNANPSTPTSAPTGRGRARDLEPYSVDRVSYSAGGVVGERSTVRFGVDYSSTRSPRGIPFNAEPSPKLHDIFTTEAQEINALKEAEVMITDVLEEGQQAEAARESLFSEVSSPKVRLPKGEALVEKLQMVKEMLRVLGDGPETRHRRLAEAGQDEGQSSGVLHTDTEAKIATADPLQHSACTPTSKSTTKDGSDGGAGVKFLPEPDNADKTERTVSYVGKAVDDPSLVVFKQELVNPIVAITNPPEVELKPVVVGATKGKFGHPPPYVWISSGSGFEFVMGNHMAGTLSESGLESLYGIIEEVVGLRVQYEDNGEVFS